MAESNYGWNTHGYTFLKYITNKRLKKGLIVDGLVQENVGNGGSVSVNKWIKQLEQPGFLPQQIVSLEEMGEDNVPNVHLDFCLWKDWLLVKWKKIIHGLMLPFGQVQAAFANFILCSDMHAYHTHICVYVCVYIFLCVCIYVSIRFLPNTVVRFGKSVFRLVSNLTYSYNFTSTNLYKTNDLMWWLINWNSALTRAQCNLLIPRVCHRMRAKLSAWFLRSVIQLWINRFEPYLTFSDFFSVLDDFFSVIMPLFLMTVKYLLEMGLMTWK